jgi:triosephosphate isomerase
LVAGNWKLHHGPQAASALTQALVAGLAGGNAVEVAIFPTAVSLPATVAAATGSPIRVGVQEVEVAASGAFTGANSAAMARVIGCTYALVGHSERRKLYGDNSARVGERLHATLAAGLLPMLCIGETLDQRKAGNAVSVVHAQLTAGLAGLPSDQATSITVAYEPVWAIGTGVTAEPAQAQEMHATIRSWLATRFGASDAATMRILYGGSVKAGNAAELFSCADVDGGLVGGASLKPDSFLSIIEAAAR